MKSYVASYLQAWLVIDMHDSRQYEGKCLARACCRDACDVTPAHHSRERLLLDWRGLCETLSFELLKEVPRQPSISKFLGRLRSFTLLISPIRTINFVTCFVFVVRR